MGESLDNVHLELIERTVHVVASPFKTGTTSVGKALLALGVGTKEMPYKGQLLKQNRGAIRQANSLVKPNVGFAEFRDEHGAIVREILQPIVKAITPYDIFPDAPFGHSHMHPFVRKVLAPKAKFIWVERDTKDWLDSVRRWEQGHPELYRRHDQWTTAPNEARERRLKDLRRARRGFLRIQQSVQEDCLVLDWSDLQSFDALVKFYGVETPQGDFPKENVSSK